MRTLIRHSPIPKVGYPELRCQELRRGIIIPLDRNWHGKRRYHPGSLPGNGIITPKVIRNMNSKQTKIGSSGTGSIQTLP